MTHYEHQIGFLKRSCKSFDEGFEEEYKRIALTIRVLLHDTRTSSSLFNQLGWKASLMLRDTAYPVVPGNVAPFGGLVVFGAPPSPNKEARYIAFLDEHPNGVVRKTFEEWWNAPAFTRREMGTLSRRDLVLTAANQDGGGHVDPSLDEMYSALISGALTDVSAPDQFGNLVTVTGAERAAIRQIAHEILRTLRPDMERLAPDPKSYGLLMGPMVFGPADQLQPNLEEARNAWPQGLKPNQVRRNDLCPCGSGRKYKHCHGAF
ncbi:SEC-C domain-containing protein [Aureimonas populi]|uniref:SEC-C domain-containing protein n=1 Tax=Aureimonas populi TaxID=1701758 RepID=A0ABW5CIN3_9HYPH|nr:SEC-C domain-containing protein [Aureimonas populi]